MSYRIIVVDDTNFMRKMAADYLKQYGYDVVGEAANGREAIRQYEELRPDIVMMDLTMPEMNGIDAIKEIMKINSDAVVLVCSASNQQELIFKALDAGAKGYLMKPFDKDRMKEIIEKYAIPHLTNQHHSESSDMLEGEDEEQPEIRDIEPEQAAEVDVQLLNYEVKNERERETDLPVKSETVVTKEPEHKPETVVPVEWEHKSSGKVKTMNPMLRNRISFVTSYMCNWQEEINGEATNFAVTCTENENKISIEMSDNGNGKQIIQFTLDGFRQLNDWLEDQLGETFKREIHSGITTII